MMKRFLFLFFAISTFSALKGGPGDSLLCFSDLTFKDDFERAAFRNFQSKGKSADILNLFLNDFSGHSSANRSVAHETFDNTVNYLEKETEGLDEDKKVKVIYKYVHKRFFKAYNLRNSFTDIFENGEYNCVSASAMYAIIFSKMQIPYLVMEAPQHVYLIAYPNTRKILIEATSPTNGYYIFKDSYTQRFVRYLHEAKLISDEEYENKTAEALFNKYYYERNGLSIFDLAGIQYCNYSVYYSDENENEKALEEIEKAYYLWPAEKTRYILQWYLSYVTSNGDYRQESNVKHLQLLCRFNKFHDKEVSAERIKYEFNRVMKAQLTESSDYAMFERSFKAISLCIEDSTLKEEIAFMYHYELARLGYLNFRSKEYELEHLKEAYRINPKHADLQTIIKSYFGKLVDKNDNVVSVSKHLESFVDDFDFLKTDLVFNTIKTNCILELAYQSYTLGEAARGEKLLNDFEDLCKHNNEMKPVERFVEKAYATAASYYYKRGNVSKTKEILKRGITYAPENFGLQMRLSQTR